MVTCCIWILVILNHSFQQWNNWFLVVRWRLFQFVSWFCLFFFISFLFLLFLFWVVFFSIYLIYATVILISNYQIYYNINANNCIFGVMCAVVGCTCIKKWEVNRWPLYYDLIEGWVPTICTTCFLGYPSWSSGSQGHRFHFAWK